MYNHKDPNVIAGLINELFTEILDLHAPFTLTVRQEGTHNINLSMEYMVSPAKVIAHYAHSGLR